jgi:hypothetical protein
LNLKSLIHSNLLNLAARVTDKLFGRCEVFLTDPAVVPDDVISHLEAVGVDQMTLQRTTILTLKSMEEDISSLTLSVVRRDPKAKQSCSFCLCISD